MYNVAVLWQFVLLYYRITWLTDLQIANDTGPVSTGKVDCTAQYSDCSPQGVSNFTMLLYEYSQPRLIERRHIVRELLSLGCYLEDYWFARVYVYTAITSLIYMHGHNRKFYKTYFIVLCKQKEICLSDSMQQ
jgi:hypothetical protein